MKPAVPLAREAQQFLVTVGEVVGLVVVDHVDGLAEFGMVPEVRDQHVHLVGGPLLGDPAVGEVDDDVPLGQRLVLAQLVVRETDAALFEQHRVVGVGRYRDGFEAALLQQGVEDPAVLLLVGAVPGDLGREVPHAGRDEGRDPGVLPPALRLAARRDRAEEPEGLVVVDDFLEQTLGREHRRHLRAHVRTPYAPGAPSQVRSGARGNRRAGRLGRKSESRRP